MQACATMDLFHSVTFDNTNNALSLTTTEEITVLQIFNSVGKMLYQLPVLSNQMVISQDFLEKGNYKLGFVLKNNTQVHFTTVSIS